MKSENPKMEKQVLAIICKDKIEGFPFASSTITCVRKKLELFFFEKKKKKKKIIRGSDETRPF